MGSLEGRVHKDKEVNEMMVYARQQRTMSKLDKDRTKAWQGLGGDRYKKKNSRINGLAVPKGLQNAIN